jgi:hypothetical protein
MPWKVVAEKSNIWADRRESAAEYSPIQENENAKLQKKSQQSPADRRVKRWTPGFTQTPSSLNFNKENFPSSASYRRFGGDQLTENCAGKKNILVKKWDRFRMAS